MRSGHNRAVDWWSLGALMYDMLTGAVSSPASSDSPASSARSPLCRRLTVLLLAATIHRRKPQEDHRQDLEV